MDDIFEKIIAREIPAEIFYEDDYVIGFLDIKPVNKGHALIVPKQKFENIFDIPEVVLGHMMSAAKKTAVAIKDALGIADVNILMNNGSIAGQEIFHAHIHVIPRLPNDGFYKTPPVTAYAESEMHEVAIKLKDALS